MGLGGGLKSAGFAKEGGGGGVAGHWHQISNFVVPLPGARAQLAPHFAVPLPIREASTEPIQGRAVPIKITARLLRIHGLVVAVAPTDVKGGGVRTEAGEAEERGLRALCTAHVGGGNKRTLTRPKRRQWVGSSVLSRWLCVQPQWVPLPRHPRCCSRGLRSRSTFASWISSTPPCPGNHGEPMQHRSPCGSAWTQARLQRGHPRLCRDAQTRTGVPRRFANRVAARANHVAARAHKGSLHSTQRGSQSQTGAR